MPAFKIGDWVVSNVNAQGMSLGQKYWVVDLLQNSTPFGCFVTYVLVGERDTFESFPGNRVLAPLARQLRVGNGHLVLSLAKGGAR